MKPGDRIKVLLLDKQHDLLIVGTAMSPEFVFTCSASWFYEQVERIDPVLFGVEGFLLIGWFKYRQHGKVPIKP